MFDEICVKTKYLVSGKTGIKDSINHNFGEIRIDSCKSLYIEKIFTIHNVIILIKSVVNENKKNFCNTLLEKGSYKDKFDTQYFKMNVCIL